MQSIRETGSKSRNFEPSQWLIENDSGKMVFDFAGECQHAQQAQQNTAVPDVTAVTGHTRIHGKGYMPFSRGKRKCLGEHFAMSELVVALLTMARHVKKIDMPHEEMTREYFVIGPHPTGLPVTFVARDRSEIPAHVPVEEEEESAALSQPAAHVSPHHEHAAHHTVHNTAVVNKPLHQDSVPISLKDHEACQQAASQV